MGDYGEAAGNFVRRTGGALMPSKIKEGFDEGVGSVMDKFNERPVLYTTLALAAAPLLIPGVGGSYARNLSVGVGAAVGGLPRLQRLLHKYLVQLSEALLMVSNLLAEVSQKQLPPVEELEEGNDDLIT